jgi:hypothetical protein
MMPDLYANQPMLAQAAAGVVAFFYAVAMFRAILTMLSGRGKDRA